MSDIKGMGSMLVQYVAQKIRLHICVLQALISNPHQASDLLKIKNVWTPRQQHIMSVRLSSRTEGVTRHAPDYLVISRSVNCNSQGQHLCERIAILVIFIWLERPRAGDLECGRVSGQWPPAAAVEAAKVYR
jgi:hypothetical protein